MCIKNKLTNNHMYVLLFNLSHFSLQFNSSNHAPKIIKEPMLITTIEIGIPIGMVAIPKRYIKNTILLYCFWEMINLSKKKINFW
jgi:hypothetical protein